MLTLAVDFHNTVLLSFSVEKKRSFKTTQKNLYYVAHMEVAVDSFLRYMFTEAGGFLYVQCTQFLGLTSHFKMKCAPNIYNTLRGQSDKKFICNVQTLLMSPSVR